MKKTNIFYALLFICTASLIMGHTHAMEQHNLNQQLIAASSEGDIKAMEKLIKDGANVDAIIESTSPLVTAVFYIKPDAIKKLLEHNANVNLLVDPKEGHNALSMAVLRNNSDIVAMLINAKADVNFPKSSILRSAVAFDRPDILKLLLKAKADPLFGIDGNKSSPIEITIVNSKLPALKLLLTYTTPQQLNQEKVRTRLLISAINWEPASLALLLAAGIDPLSPITPNRKDGIRMTPLEYARSLENKTSALFLENFLVTPSEVDRINTAMLSIRKADPQPSRDVRNILKSNIINVIIQEKIDRIKAALPQGEWNDIDQKELHKALEIAIRRALESDSIKAMLGK